VQIWNGESDSILDDYSNERRQYAIESVQLYTDQQYNNMVMSAEEERERRNKSLAEAASDPVKARAYLLKASMLEERI
jgi:3-(3-hydroxy-phenyl)propionate hydroxylase